MSKTTSEAHSNLFDVKDYVVCVTGASSGLGRATATILANRGARVIGIARSREELEAWQESGHGETAIVSADLCKREEFPKVIKEVTAPFGAPDILINAAGVNLRRPADIVSQEEWDQTIQLNLNAPFFLAQAFVPGMKTKKWGRIVNFASFERINVKSIRLNRVGYGIANICIMFKHENPEPFEVVSITQMA